MCVLVQSELHVQTDEINSQRTLTEWITLLFVGSLQLSNNWFFQFHVICELYTLYNNKIPQIAWKGKLFYGLKSVYKSILWVAQVQTLECLTTLLLLVHAYLTRLRIQRSNKKNKLELSHAKCVFCLLWLLLTICEEVLSCCRLQAHDYHASAWCSMGGAWCSMGGGMGKCLGFKRHRKRWPARGLLQPGQEEGISWCALRSVILW